jgi:hypothetical protein
MSLQITISCVLLAGDPAKDVLKDALQDLMVMCRHIRGTFLIMQ